MRQILLEAIGKLDPGPALPARARQRRIHQILELRYVEGLPFREVMQDLALSQRQYHRDQRHALESIASLLWESIALGSQSVGAAGPASGVAQHADYAEVDAIAHAVEEFTDLNDAARGVVAMLHQATPGLDVAVLDALADRPALIPCDRTAARQLLVTLVGYALEGARGGMLALSSREDDGKVILRLDYRDSLVATALESPRETDRLHVARQLLEPLRGSLSVGRDADRLLVTVELPVQRRSLLVIDDHPDIVQLIGRLIADQNLVVRGASSVREGLALARGARPDAILLDIMMPAQDGWDALQALKHDPATQDIPVVVCTVLGESHLALALGAVGFIQKPVTRPALLAALAPLLRPPPEATRRGSPEPSGPGD